MKTKKKIVTLWLFMTILFCTTGNTSEDNVDSDAKVHLNNLSDYPVAVIFTPINADRSVNPNFPPSRLDLRSTQEIVVVLNDTTEWQIYIVAESDAVMKEANLKSLAGAGVGIAKGGVMIYSGTKNYSLRNENNEKVLLRELERMRDGDGISSLKRARVDLKDIPKYDNPINGYLDGIEGAGLALQGVVAALTFARKNTATIIVNPKMFNQSTEFKGVRLDVINCNSGLVTGIEVKSNLINKGAKRGLFRARVEDLY